MSGGKTFRGFQRRGGVPRRGFTLIELLVVISVVVLLMALMLPALSRARKQAQAVVCQSRLRQWGLLFKVYTDTNEGRWFMKHIQSEGRTGPNNWLGLVAPFLRGNIPLAACPTATKYTPDEDAVTAFTAWWPAGKDVAVNQTGELLYGPVSYGFNRFISWSDNEDPRTPSSRKYSWGLSDVRGAARVPVLCDCLRANAGASSSQGPPPRDAWPFYFHQPMCINRHNGGINMLFMDWSARKVGLKELWTLKWYPGYDTAGPWTIAGGVLAEDWPEWMRGFKDY